MTSNQFRRQLKREVARWRQDAWISPEQHARITSHYDLDQIDGSAYGQFISLLVGIGCVLIGIGCITFVAANWQLIPRLFKVILLVSVFLAVSVAGRVLQQRSQMGQRRLGEALLLLGSLIFGGNLALMGQMFHQSGSGYGLCAIWSLGTLAMAYGLRLVSLCVLAQLLMGVAYGLWLRDGLWTGSAYPSGLDLLFQQMSLVTLLLFLPLAYRDRSRSIFVLTALGVVCSLVVRLAELPEIAVPMGVAAALVATLPPALLWVYDDRPWCGGGDPRLSFRPAARAIAMIYLCGVLYVTSFHGFWKNTQLDSTVNPEANASLLLLSVTTLTAAAMAGWIYLGWPRRSGGWRLVTADAALLGVLALSAGLCLVHWHIAPIPIVATFLVNILLAVLGIGAMREGLGEGDRSRFWWGLVLLVLQIISRVLEYNTGLLVKSAVFLACGVAVIVLGLWFERFIRPSDRAIANRSTAN
ncbi:MAG: DUF2157 domain-containing protein [Elainellaceae cyanobacterium]